MLPYVVGMLLLSSTQYLPILFAPTPGLAIAAVFWMTLISGMAGASIGDLLIRSYPRGLEGSAFGLVVTVTALISAFTNQWGAALYERWGLGPGCWLGGLINLLILPLVFLVPRSVVAPQEAPLTGGDIHPPE